VFAACSCLACSWRHSQSFQHRTLIPVHACSLDSGAPRYDSLTVSDSPPSSEPFVRSSVTPRTRRLLANASSLRDGRLLPPVCTACSPHSAWVLSPCIATLDSIRVRASTLDPPFARHSTRSPSWRPHCFRREALPSSAPQTATWSPGTPARRRCRPCKWT
jgi:hypothetical protein